MLPPSGACSAWPVPSRTAVPCLVPASTRLVAPLPARASSSPYRHAPRRRWALFALYAQLGVSLFGGLVKVDYWSRDDPQALYAYCNFNDFGSAVLTLFELLVVNNWHDIMGVVVDLTSPWSVLYFVSWYVPDTPVSTQQGRG